MGYTSLFYMITEIFLLHHPRVSLEQLGDALALGHLGGEAVGLHHEAVVLAVGLQQLLGHERGVVEVGQRGVGIQGAGIEYRLG